MRLRICLLLALLANLFFAGSAGASEWKVYRYADEGFAAEFPGEPAPKAQKLDPRTQVHAAQYWSSAEGAVYGVSVTRYRPELAVSKSVDLSELIGDFATSLKCSASMTRLVTLPGTTARESIMHHCQAIQGGGAWVRMIFAGDWLYQVMVLSPQVDVADGGDAKRFVTSFNVTAH